MLVSMIFRVEQFPGHSDDAVKPDKEREWALEQKK